MNIQQYAKALKSPLFGERDSVQEAYEYAISMAAGNPEVLVAMQVMMNTISNDLEALLKEQAITNKKSDLEQIVEGWVSV